MLQLTYLIILKLESQYVAKGRPFESFHNAQETGMRLMIVKLMLKRLQNNVANAIGVEIKIPCINRMSVHLLRRKEGIPICD